ncbi:hypothetical protein ACS3SW_20345 [Roseobacteraceae bacterium S113]
MSVTPHTRTDLTRWNRAGRTRFDYVDGNAAVWLEELRLALLGLYMRDGPVARRAADDWRDLWLAEADPARRAAPDLAALLDQVDWPRLTRDRAQTTETRGQRAARLAGQYLDGPEGDHARELLRAFSRASHVLTGHLEAYANEGYLRTATQWDNLRRLAALVNYQPTPPASASTLVALALKPDAGQVEIAPGLPVKYSPKDGGAPLLFESIEPLLAHPALNAARLVGWQDNTAPITLDGAGTRWQLPEKSTLATGDIVVFADATRAEAGTLAARVDHDTGSHISLATTSGALTLPKGAAQLFTEVEAVRTGLPRPAEGLYDLYAEGGAGLLAGDLVRATSGATSVITAIEEIEGERIRLRTAEPLAGQVLITPLDALSPDKEGVFQAPVTTPTGTVLHYMSAAGVLDLGPGGAADEVEALLSGDEIIGYAFTPKGLTAGLAFVETPQSKVIQAKVGEVQQIDLPQEAGALHRVSFAGKPPKSLTSGSWLVARTATGALTPLRVTQIVTRAGQYDLTFDRAVTTAPESTEFHGPLKTPVRAQGHDRNPRLALPGDSYTLRIEALPEPARGALRPGRDVILSDETDPTRDVAATLTRITAAPDGTVTLAVTPAGDARHLIIGHTLVRMNALTITHGETKGPKTLGSGDGEFGAQVFTLQVPEISHVPSARALSGVLPDIKVAVDGTVWEYRDYTDLSAEGAPAWSSTLGEDGLLRLHFRRRLPTGTNNITLLGHRVGVGARGNAVPPLSMVKPTRKNPHVEALHQPFATSGGADREATSSLRRNAPARLVANGRAVSLADFERLTEGHASVLRARAEEVAAASVTRDITLTIVPAGGGALTQALQTQLDELIAARAIPGVRPLFDTFGPVRLEMGARIRADLTSHDKSDIRAAAAEVLHQTFDLSVRDFGQPIFVAEILAALETVPGILTAQATGFGVVPGAPDYSQAPERIARRDNAVAAIYPFPNQVAFLDPAGSHLALDITGERP